MLHKSDKYKRFNRLFFVFLFLVGVTRLKVDEGKMDSAPGKL